MTRRRRPLALLAASLAFLLGISDRARAENLLRAAGAVAPGANAASAQAAAQASQAAQAALIAQRAASPLSQALESIRAWEAAQAAARSAAALAPANVPDGLTPGGLWPAQGYAVPELGLWQGAGPPVEHDRGRLVEVRITQTAPRALLTWETFNVGPLTRLRFDQSAGGADAASWVALNKIQDPATAPSQILGRISAEGQVYVLNRNGILFGGASRVDVGSLVASGLDIAPKPGVTPDQRFLSETLQTLSFTAPTTPGAGAVTVRPGALISSSVTGGRVVLVGTEVANAGSLHAPDGQIVLAAAGPGGGIALSAAPDLSKVRGLDVPRILDSTGTPIVGPDGGTVVNTGLVAADRGNVTIVAGRTEQNGAVTATTAAQANGSIWIGGDGLVTSLGGASLTQILPDENGQKVIGAGDAFKASAVDVRGDQITLQDGARIYAPSGTVTLSALMTAPGTTDDTRVYVGAGASIDVSGLPGVPVPMERNSIRADLRANELADDPLLRDDPAIRGRTVWFDARRGVDPKVANLSGYYDLVERNVSELMTTGGRIELDAGELIARKGSVLDLSGGSTRWLDGTVRRTLLIAPNGDRVPIELSKPGVAYVGIDGDLVVQHSRWALAESFRSGLGEAAPQLERGYELGASAGTLQLGVNRPAWFTSLVATADPSVPLPPDPSAVARVRILDGTVRASALAGPTQRQPASPAPSGETFAQRWQREFREQPGRGALVVSAAGDVAIGDPGTHLPDSFGAADPVDPALRYRHDLPAAWFDGKGFQTLSIQAGFDPDSVTLGVNMTPGLVDRAPGGRLTVGPDVRVDLGDGGSFSFKGKSAVVDGTIVAPGGSIAVSTTQQGGDPAPSASFHLGASALLDVAGRYTNDAAGGAVGPIRTADGGKVSITASSVVLEAGSEIDVSGGARLDQTGAKLTAGKGGAISIDASRYPSPGGTLDQTAAYPGTLVLGGALEGWALQKGGSLTLRTGFDLVVGNDLGDAAGAAYPRLFTPAFFTHGGFASYTLLGEQSVTVTSGTVLAPVAESFALRNPGAVATGARLTRIAGRQVLPIEARAPMSLALTTHPSRIRSINSPVPDWRGESQDLFVESGATIRMLPGSTVTLSSTNVLRVDGAIDAPGGTISLTVNDVPVVPPASTLAAGPGVAGPGVYLERGASLDAGGWLGRTLVSNGRIQRSVQPGGTIALSSTADVRVEAGAILDVSGTSGVADVVLGPSGQDRFVPVLQEGNAGAVSIRGRAGAIEGTLRLSPGGPSGIGGALTLQQVSGGDGAIVVAQGRPGTATAKDLAISAGAVSASGADDVTLQGVLSSGNYDFARPGVLFERDVDLRARRSLTIAAPTLQPALGAAGAVSLSAARVSLQGVSAASAPASDGVAPEGALTVRGDLVDVARAVVFGCVPGLGTCTAGGFATVRLQSTGDLRLSDHDASGIAGSSPGLYAPGALSLEGAQVYVASRLLGGDTLERAPDDPGFLVRAGTRIDVRGNGRDAPFPLSFGERLTLEAPTIDQAGVLRAPQGQIRLVGTGGAGSVTLESGSLTSSSLEAHVVPFGAVQSGGLFSGYDQAGSAPSKSVSLSGASVVVASGAVVDVSGGGDLQGFIFAPGLGGTKDVLSSSTGYAILPWLGTGSSPGVRAPGPISPEAEVAGGSAVLRDGRLGPGDQIWLQGVPGLAPGYYTLLPAHYALLPGGLLVQPVGGSYAGPPASSARWDGAVLAAGCLTSAGSCAPASGHAIYGQWAVLSQPSFGRYSQFLTYSFDQAASALAASRGVPVRTPADAGGAVLDASSNLVLQGTGRLGSPAGLLGTLDVAAPEIAVVGPGATAPAGYLALDPSALAAFGAGSVLLGGTRAPSAQGTVLSVRASDVVVDTGAMALAAPEILLAGASVRIAPGSAVRAVGTATVDSSALLVQNAAGGGDAAVVRVSSGERVAVVHVGATGQAGDLDVGAGATLSAAGSLTLDASRSMSLAPDAVLSGRQVDLASTRVNLGDAPAGTPGATLGSTTLGALSSASDVVVRGDRIDVYGPVALGRRSAGAVTLGRLTLDTAILQGHGGGASFTAGDLTLENRGAAASDPGASGAGNLAIDADTLHLGPGTTRVAGLGAITGQATVIEAQGTGELDFAGDLSLRTSEVRAKSGASVTLSIGGKVDLSRPSGATPPTPTAGELGGRIRIDAAAVSLDTTVTLPAGRLEANASAGDLVLGPTASIGAAGESADFDGTARAAPGGTIRLSASGDVVVAPGATLDVSGPSQGGDAGAIEFAAGGAARLEGVLRGGAAKGAAGGAFALDAGTLGGPTLSALAASLEAGGFDSAVEVRLRTGDLTVGTADVVAAHEVALRADTGRVTVAGRIDAAGSGERADGGIVRLTGGAGVAVTGTIDASAAAAPAGGFDPESGRVELVAAGGTADLAPGALVDLSGGRAGGGMLVVRAPRAGSDVAVDRLAGDVRGAREVVVQGSRDYAATAVDATLASAVLADAAAWLSASRASITARLGVPPSEVAAAASVTSAGDLSVQADLPLRGTFGPGSLSLVAGRDLVLENLQLLDQDRRLHGVEASCQTKAHIVVFVGALAVNANAAQRLGKLVIIGKDGATIAEAAERFCREEAGRGRKSQRTDPAALVARTKTLGCVIEHEQALGLRDLGDRIVVGALAEQVDGDHGPGLQAALLRRRDATPERGGIHVVGCFIDIDENRRRAGQRHGFAGGAECKRWT